MQREAGLSLTLIHTQAFTQVLAGEEDCNKHTHNGAFNLFSVCVCVCVCGVWCGVGVWCVWCECGVCERWCVCVLCGCACGVWVCVSVRVSESGCAWRCV